MLSSFVTTRRPVPSALAIFAALMAVVLFAALVGIGVQWTAALFKNAQPAAANLSAAHIFRGERDTPAFAITDSSSGSAVDGSSPLGFAGDSRYFTSWVWPASFDTSRYLELDLNSPLPAGLAVSNAQLTVRAAANSAGVTTCYYVEVRRASSGNLVSTHGSSGSPLDCVTGTTFEATDVSISAVSSTDIANDLRIRIYAQDSAAGAVRLDRVVATGDTPHAPFTLYSILTRDRHDGQSDVIPWGLAGQ